MRDRYMWGAAPHPDREPLYMGLRPKPHSRTFLPKSPRDPKKPNWVRFNLSNKDSKQGCRRQPCFWFSANCSYCFSDEGKKLKVRSTKIMQQNKTKQARPSSLLLLSIEAALTNFANRTSIVSINNAKANSSNFSGLERSLCLPAREHNRGGEVRFLREERRAPCLGCYHKTEQKIRGVW